MTQFNKAENPSADMEALRSGLEQIINNSTNKDSLNAMMEYLGTAFCCERIYIFVKDHQGRYNCNYEWCREGVPYNAMQLQGLTADDVHTYYDAFRQNRANNFKIIIRNRCEVKESHPELHQILEGANLQSLLAGQLVFEGEDLGFFGIDNPDLDQFQAYDVVFEVLGYFTSALLHSERLIAKLEKIGYEDRMTGTGNRYSLFETIEDMPEGEQLAVTYYDIVNLKRVNDALGHRSGDELIMLAAHILKMIYGRDNVYRLGGNEFLTLLRGDEAKFADVRAMSARSTLEKDDIRVMVGSAVTYNYRRNFSELLTQADRRMFRAKRKSRENEEEQLFGGAPMGTFSELIEIHPQSDYYRVLYSDRTRSLTMDGRFWSIIRSMEKLIKPEDRERFHLFWDSTNILRRMHEDVTERMVTEQFAVMDVDGGSYCIEIKMILFGEQNAAPVFMCFTRTFEEEDEVSTALSGGVISEHHEGALTLQSADFFIKTDAWLHDLSPRYSLTFACDLNNFKLFNEIFGREAGDAYLRKFETFIAGEAAKYGGTSAYLGGDNFCMVIPSNDPLEEDVLVDSIENSILEVGFKDGFLPSVGVCISGDPDEFVSSCYDHAMVALGNVRGNFTEHVAVYDDFGYQKERNTQILLIDAARALQDGEFKVFLQPKVEIATGNIIGAEALVRWKHEGKMLQPGAFVEAMENNGYIAAVDRFVWEETCKWLSGLGRRGITPLPVSVNVSRVDIHFIDLEEFFIHLVDKYHLDPKLLQIEVTESAYTENTYNLNGTMKTLREQGFTILMDDFGSGYSSLNMLQDAEVDVLKLDRGFMTVKRRQRSAKILRSAVDMAQMLGMEVIAEGVETKEQGEMLRGIGCQYCQGYYFYQPMPIGEFEQLLKKQQAGELLKQWENEM